MSLSDGEPASDGDVWFRIATHKDYIKNGRVNHGAFGGKAIGVPDPQKRRPWDRELSGRLRSIAGSVPEITSHAERFCAEQTARGGGKKEFHGVIYSRVLRARNTYEDAIASNVYFTPNSPADDAHADLAFTGWNIADNDKPQLEEFTIWLSDQLSALYRVQLEEHLPKAEIPSLFKRAVSAIRGTFLRLKESTFSRG